MGFIAVPVTFPSLLYFLLQGKDCALLFCSSSAHEVEPGCRPLPDSWCTCCLASPQKTASCLVAYFMLAYLRMQEWLHFFPS